MSERITFGERFGYGLGDLASNLFWMQFVWFLNYFYTDVFGLAPAVLATMILVVRIWDSINDPIIGILADRTHSRWGKFRPYLLWGAIPFGIVGALTFATPDFSPGGKLGMAVLSYIGYQANAEQTPQALAGIKGMVSWISAIPCAIGFALILFYPLTQPQLNTIEADLAARRANGENNA